MHPTILLALAPILAGRPTFVLTWSNDNPGGFGRDWISCDAFVSEDDVLNGRRPWPPLADVREIIAERRVAGLDANNGLSPLFVETVQVEARRNLDTAC